jgi:hypothetical protein
MIRHLIIQATLLLAIVAIASAAYIPQHARCQSKPTKPMIALHAKAKPFDDSFLEKAKWTFSAFCLASIVLASSPVHADEYGVEKEAPTLFTGESVMVRTKNIFHD